MKHTILIITALTVCALSVHAQETASVSSVDPINALEATKASKTTATFPGGKDALARYLAEHLHYTDEARANALEGVVLVAFQVREDGRPFGFEVVETPHTLLSACALTTLKGMPDWIPAQREGQPVERLGGRAEPVRVIATTHRSTAAEYVARCVPWLLADEFRRDAHLD
ncbi:MAG: energy transducer TonB, partial [Saprospiraceae bacterium]|nr:energy transducer TonB [Saprospiraceae bacterium]